MNFGALIKHLVAGAVNGVLGLTGIDALFKDVTITGWHLILGAGGLGALRALQEYLSPTAFVRPVTDGTTTATLAAKPSPEG